MRQKPEILKQSVIARSRLFKIEQLELRFANGQERVFERLRGSDNGAVLIVPLLDNETVLLVREYAAGVDRYELSLPKGLMDTGETVIEAANREMMEEIGYAANSLEVLTTMTISPHYFSARTTIVVARDLYPKKIDGDEPEALEVVPWKLSELNSLLQRDDFSEARSIAALFWVRELLNPPASLALGDPLFQRG